LVSKLVDNRKYMIKQRFKGLLSHLLKTEQCPKRLSRSFCIGTYIAFSPFIGLHSVMIISLSWLLGLELAATFAAAWLINNPWTMLPIYALGYNTGEFLLGKICGLNTAIYNPSWIEPLTTRLGSLLGLPNLSLWSFIIGGNILGLSIACLLYPLIKPIFEQLIREKKSDQKDPHL